MAEEALPAQLPGLRGGFLAPRHHRSGAAAAQRGEAAAHGHRSRGAAPGGPAAGPAAPGARGGPKPAAAQPRLYQHCEPSTSGMDCAPQIRDLNRVLGIRRGSFRATPGLLSFFSLSFLRTHRCAELGCFLQQTRLPARGRGAEQPRGWMNSCPSEPDPSQGEITERRRRRAGLSGANSLSAATPGTDWSHPRDAETSGT